MDRRTGGRYHWSIELGNLVQHVRQRNTRIVETFPQFVRLAQIDEEYPGFATHWYSVTVISGQFL
jgi:hypothetical protein